MLHATINAVWTSPYDELGMVRFAHFSILCNSTIHQQKCKEFCTKPRCGMTNYWSKF